MIVGAGSAGCVLADRLASRARQRAAARIRRLGPLAVDSDAHRAHHPHEYAALRLALLHRAGAAAEHRRLHTPRGKVLGGSSSINGLVYVRGNALDYERWEAQGARGWGYADVLPYFRRAERAARGGDDYRGAQGKLATRRRASQEPAASGVALGRAAGGLPASEDMNGFQQEGFARMDMTVGDGRRCSAANAYLRPAMARTNVEVRTHALATRIVFAGSARSGCATCAAALSTRCGRGAR